MEYNLPKLFAEDSRDIVLLANGGQGAKAILKTVEKWRDDARRQNEDAPRLDDDDWRKDARFVAGQIFMANKILGLAEAAKQYIERNGE